MKAVIYPNFQKNNALDCARKLCDILNQNDIEVFIDSDYITEFSDKSFVQFDKFREIVKTSDFAIAVGGDGTILKCVKQLVDFNTKLIGINTGRLGFMSALEFDQLEQIKKIKTNEYKISERMMIEAEIETENGIIKKEALEGSGLKMTWLEREIKKSKLSQKEIFLMTVDDAGKINIIKKEK